jgi:hypothetical protein
VPRRLLFDKTVEGLSPVRTRFSFMITATLWPSVAGTICAALSERR